jgi:hypothetical protein
MNVDEIVGKIRGTVNESSTTEEPDGGVRGKTKPRAILSPGHEPVKFQDDYRQLRA